MSTSSYKRLPLAGLSILIVWTLINVLAHRLFLAPIYASTPHLWRPFDQMNVALIYTVTFGLIDRLYRTRGSPPCSDRHGRGGAAALVSPGGSRAGRPSEGGRVRNDCDGASLDELRPEVG